MTLNQSLATTSATALDRLNKSKGRSLDEMVKARTRRSLLLVDCSGSMAEGIAAGGRKIDALRKVVATLQETHKVPIAAFGVRAPGQVEVVDVIPDPQGGTPVDLAIDFAKAQGANHIVMVTDGQPNDRGTAFASARTFGGAIDVFYIGDGRDGGAQFAAELAEMTGGKCGVTDLGKPKELSATIAGLLGDGSELI